MKKHVKQLLKHPLIQSSVIVIFGNLFANFFSFLFNLFMSRNLTVVDYGVLASVSSLISLPILLISAMGPLIVKFAGEYFAKNRLDLLKGLYIKITKFLLFIAVSVFIVLLIFLNQLSQFFHIDDKNIVFITIAIIALSIIGLLNYMLMQAKLAFKFQVSSLIFNALIKLVFGVALVYLGFSAVGAVFAIFLSVFLGYIYSFIPFRFIFKIKAGILFIEAKDFFTYGIPSALVQFGLAALISTDIILVKHFFPPEQAGIYAGLSLVGKVIFYVSSPIGGVMFPIIVQKINRKEKTAGTFILSLLLVLGSSVALTFFYLLYPDFTLLFFLKKNEYLTASGLLGLFGIFVTLYSLTSIISNFYLSINKTKIMVPIIFGAVLQIILICFYHQNFLQIILTCLFVTLAVLIILIIYYPFAVNKKRPYLIRVELRAQPSESKT